MTGAAGEAFFFRETVNTRALSPTKIGYAAVARCFRSLTGGKKEGTSDGEKVQRPVCMF